MLRDAIGGYDPDQYMALFTITNRDDALYILYHNEANTQLLLSILEDQDNNLHTDMYRALSTYYNVNYYIYPEIKDKLRRLILRFPHLVIHNNYIGDDVQDWYKLCGAELNLVPFMQLALAKPSGLTSDQQTDLFTYLRSCYDQHPDAAILLANNPDILKYVGHGFTAPTRYVQYPNSKPRTPWHPYSC